MVIASLALPPARAFLARQALPDGAGSGRLPEKKRLTYFHISAIIEL
jgi:hypothetical protein